MKTLVIANQKGGTGKSTFACMAAMYFAGVLNKKVAFINCETQANSCSTLKKKHSLASVNTGAFFTQESFVVTPTENITVFQGGQFLADVDKSQGGFFKGQVNRLVDSFDICIIDTPPTTNVLQIAPLTVADFVISPIELEDYSMRGVADMIKTILGVRQKFNPSLEFLGMLPNRLKGSSARQKAAFSNLVTKYPQFMFEPDNGPRIGERVAIPEALGEGIPVWELKKSSAKEASEEVLKVFGLLAKRVGIQ